MFAERLHGRAQQHLLRKLKTVDSATGPTVRFEGREVVLLASNDYLGLAIHPMLKQAALEAVHEYGVGAGASRLVSGNLPPHRELETALARFKHTEAALVFGSGYLANIGLIPTMIGPGGMILADRLCHASLLDGCRLSRAEFRIYEHADPSHLEALLVRYARRNTLIVTDGVFSMDGDIAPLPDLAALAQGYGARLYIDDAHGTGVMGQCGRGILEHFHLESRVPFHMGTLGKALGGIGAYVVGPSEAIHYFVNNARSFLFTTALPPASAAAATAALQVIQNEPDRLIRLWSNRERLWSGLRRLGFRMTTSASPIMPILVGDAEKANAMAEKLLTHGVYAPAIRPPTVPEGTSRIRVTVTSEHSASHIDQALAAFDQAGRSVGLI
jgi:glycine C-acetyltransferase/8-amino-7-oxononanoate synthase